MEFNQALILYAFAIGILSIGLVTSFILIRYFILKTGNGKWLLRPMFRRNKNE